MKFIPLFMLICAVGFNTSVEAQSLELPFQSQVAPVVLPTLPSKLTFAGERVPLENYDTRESLTRELLITMYMHSKTLQVLLATGRYFPVIEPILKQYGVPSDFKYLCMAESGLNPNVMSGAKAGGLWQLMPATGEEYGLEVGGTVDERYHIEKATRAACQYLLKAKERFGSWTMAAAAYNLGSVGVERRAQKQRVTNYYDLFLPEETLRYVFRVLAFKVITENPSTYGFVTPRQNYYAPLTDYREITVNDPEIDWSAVAVANGTTYKMLRELNHWIRDYDHPNKSGKSYIVKIPAADIRTH